MLNKALRRNLIPSTALTAGTKTSQVEQSTYGRGVRFYVTLSSVSTTGSTDKLFLCAQVPGTTNVIPLAGFSGASMLSTAGTWVFDFYPGAWLPSQVASGGQSMGALGIHLPLVWAVELMLGAGSAATVVVDAEVLP
jgi:hypothetical protein